MSAKSRASGETSPAYFTDQDIKDLNQDCLFSLIAGGDRWLINPMNSGRYVLSQYQLCDKQIIRQVYYWGVENAREDMLEQVSSMARDLVC